MIFGVGSLIEIIQTIFHARMMQLFRILYTFIHWFGNDLWKAIIRYATILNSFYCRIPSLKRVFWCIFFSYFFVSFYSIFLLTHGHTTDVVDIGKSQYVSSHLFRYFFLFAVVSFEVDSCKFELNKKKRINWSFKVSTPKRATIKHFVSCRLRRKKKKKKKVRINVP